MLKIRSRPLSPHLTIYKPQITSVFSIWHRITGILLTLIMNYILILLKLSIYFPFDMEFNLFLNHQLNFPDWIINTLILNLLIFFLFHFLNGIRHIIWDLGFILSIKMIYRTARLTSFFLFLILINLTLKIFN
uniref:Succinate:cytochrome c oxidoreductase subunit 3 n=1 Tax=Rhodogorgon sp. TaxID=2485824 RepID=A0A3G3MIQ1_9FLOR|nr:succinate:cytochrome c oxidoreductase subunit 3 [Rhodogorgon sp.]